MSKKRKRKTTVSLGNILIIAAIVLLTFGAWKLYYYNNQNPAPEINIASQANFTHVITDKGLPEQIKKYPGMTVSFNARMHVPNWVAWELTGEKANGKEARNGSFYNDPDITGCAETYDYSYSGYDRGHMAPAGDMKWSKEAMLSSFTLANICPQVKSLNTGAWKRLEEKCRVWAKADSAIYIVCGPVLNDSIREYIGDTRVAVPKRFFKVILSPYSSPARGIGFIMPNDKVPGGMQACAVSIDEIEHITGHDFFSELPDSIEDLIEQQCDFHYWSRIRVK